MKNEWGKEKYTDECTRKERMGYNMARSRDMETKRNEAGICEGNVLLCLKGQGAKHQLTN
jgi:hypothetical protein